MAVQRKRQLTLNREMKVLPLISFFENVKKKKWTEQKERKLSYHRQFLKKYKFRKYSDKKCLFFCLFGFQNFIKL